MRRTKIICTIGPASESPEVLRAMMRAGMDVARLNFSHGDHVEHQRRLEACRQVARELGRPLGIMLDTRGPEIRVGTFEEGAVELEDGACFTLTTNPVSGDKQRVSVNYSGLNQDVFPGASVLLDDGLIELEVELVEGEDVHCRVVHGGTLKNRKRVNLPDSQVQLPSLSQQDQDDLECGVRLGVDMVAASFIRNGDHVLNIKRFLEEKGADLPLIAKIESPEGVENLNNILKVADGIMVARGDLGVEMSAEEVPILQKMMIERANQAGRPVITATQMLESMVENTRPTRAEASDVANAILDGSDAIMLSAETAAGKHPVEVVATMDRIARRAEASLDHGELLRRHRSGSPQTITDAVGYAACATAHDLRARAILTATESGYTACMVSKHRPQAPIVAVTTSEKICQQLSLVWGVCPVLRGRVSTTDELFDQAVAAGIEHGFMQEGDLVVITAGHPVGKHGTTNALKVHTVGDVLIRGTGVGRQVATGRVCVGRHPRNLGNRFRPGDILVTVVTDREFMPYLEQAGAIITEEPGLTSHAAVVGLNLGIPVVVGAKGAMELLAHEEYVTVDSSRGLIYRGQARSGHRNQDSYGQDEEG